MTKQPSLQLFEQRKVRTVWDDEAEKWYFSVVDVIEVLMDSDYQAARKYWKVLKGRLAKEGNETVTNCYQLKQRLKAEGNESVTNCHGFKLKAADGKMRMTDVADTEQLFRIIQSVPSPKAEPFKQWMAQVANSRQRWQKTELVFPKIPKNYKPSEKVMAMTLGALPKGTDLEKELEERWAEWAR